MWCYQCNIMINSNLNSNNFLILEALIQLNLKVIVNKVKNKMALMGSVKLQARQAKKLPANCVSRKHPYCRACKP